MSPPSLSNLAFEQVFTLSAPGAAELQRGVTDLSAPELELMVRLDGAATLREVRAAMTSLSEAAFVYTLNRLHLRGFVVPREEDKFDAESTTQLRLLGLGESKPAAPRRNGGFNMGLARRRPAREFPAGRVFRAVVVEDDPALARFVECFLALEGFEVRLAANRHEVVLAIRQGVPDVFLLDGSLPDVDGFQVLRIIRNHEHLQSVPVLMMTARATREGVLEALTHGADGYLTKPVDAELLINAVRAVIGLPEKVVKTSRGPWINPDALIDKRTHA